MKMTQLKGKVALITGSSSGIGQAIALDLAKSGAHVVITGRDEKRIKNVVQMCEELGKDGKYIGVKAELTNDKDIEKLVNTTIKELGQIDILVHNAGSFIVASFQSPDYLKSLDLAYNLKIRSVQVLTLLVLSHLEKSKGVIINISGTFPLKIESNVMAFGMCESALDMFTKCLALELGPKHIRVVGIAPGPTRTPIMSSNASDSGFMEKADKYCQESNPLRRMGEAQDVANLVTFLATDKASYITGTTITIDGGYNVSGMTPVSMKCKE